MDDTKEKINSNQHLVEEETIGLSHSNVKLENISTNREYDAVHSEIATHKKNIDTAQASILHYQQVLENYQKDFEAIQGEYNSVLESNEPELKKLSAELNGIEDRIAAEAAKTESPRKKISRRVLSVYDRVMTRRLTPYIIGFLNRHHKACKFCNREQTAQKISDINKRKSLNTCESCGAILIWKEDMDRTE